ncbi:hypothetical protein L1274_000596 [Duganella sp. HSC-15S17]|uniref:Uncharacterized protein n=1 Tax=Duganella violaceipulchra TaxID=2849652 RepID=A0ABT1GH57_9BURK|nr:hypothetical protein [Duganella violaceicalia]MCP2006908.1 hypothetical protein [Duganella violaceicalia]
MIDRDETTDRPIDAIDGATNDIQDDAIHPGAREIMGLELLAEFDPGGHQRVDIAWPIVTAQGDVTEHFGHGDTGMHHLNRKRLQLTKGGVPEADGQVAINNGDANRHVLQCRRQPGKIQPDEFFTLNCRFHRSIIHERDQEKTLTHLTTVVRSIRRLVVQVASGAVPMKRWKP